MKHNITEVKINLDHVLWRTRSKEQDYQFIKVPKSPFVNGWYSFFEKVFSGREPSREPKNIIGKIVLSKNNPKNFWFVATCFIDDKYLDFSGRPINQYLIWFPHDDYDIPKIEESLANDWGKDFLAPSEELYPPFYESSNTSQLDKETHIIIKRSDDNFQELKYTEGPNLNESESVARVAVPSPDADHKSSERDLGHTDQKTKNETEETFEVAIEKAIEEGVSWASLEYLRRPWFLSHGLWSMPNKIKKSNKELERFLQCLATSFGGNTKDQFLEIIAKNYKSIASEFINNPQKGFDSIVNVFTRYKRHERLLNLDENEGNKFISECIKGGASVDDECIRHIYLRLRKLAEQDKGKQ